MVPRRTKAVMCFLWSLNAFYQLYTSLGVVPGQGWQRPIEVCAVSSECIDSFSMYIEALATIGLFAAKYCISLVRSPEALIVLKASVVQSVGRAGSGVAPA